MKGKGGEKGGAGRERGRDGGMLRHAFMGMDAPGAIAEWLYWPPIPSVCMYLTKFSFYYHCIYSKLISLHAPRRAA